MVQYEMYDVDVQLIVDLKKLIVIFFMRIIGRLLAIVNAARIELTTGMKPPGARYNARVEI